MTPAAAAAEAYRQLFSQGPFLAEVRRCAEFAAVDADLATAVADAAAAYAAKVLAPLNRPADEEGSRLADGRVLTPAGFDEAYRLYAEGGWTALDAPADAGGQQLPQVVQLAVSELMIGACMAFAMLPLQMRAAAKVLVAHGSDEVKSRYLTDLVAGRCTATIAMTEPQAGSDVGRALARAVPRGDGRYALHGTKSFISWADHGFTEQIVHLVLARTPGAAAGTRGLSLFLVPKWNEDTGGRARNAAQVIGVERKMGIHASPTCVLQLDGAAGWLLGAEGEGMRAIFTMVNTMRLEVAIQGVAIAHTACEKAAAYAAERLQGGPADAPPLPIDRHPDVRRMLATMRLRVRGMRLLVLHAAACVDLSQCADTPDERRSAGLLAQWLLPVCKALGSETGFEVANTAVQVLGGNGYVRDYEVEQHLRDVRISSIFEGANGIQAIDLLTRKLGGENQERFHAFTRWVEAGAAGDGDGMDALRAPLRAASALLAQVTAEISRTLADRPDVALAGATAYLQLVGCVALGAVWARACTAGYPWAADGARLYAATLKAQTELHACHALQLAPLVAAQGDARI